MIISAGHANKFVFFTFPDNPAGFITLVLLSTVLAVKKNIVFNKRFFLLLFCYLIYYLAITIKYGEIHPTIFIFYSLLFYVVYVVIHGLKSDLFALYETVLFHLAIVGLVMWLIQVIMGGDTLYNYFGKISSIADFSFVTMGGLNTILYSVQPSSASVLFDFLPPRNCGFAWEPGGFAVFLCLAIFINLFITKTYIKSKIQFGILVLALLSTQSTTGYVIFLIIILSYYFNRKLGVVLLLLPVVIAVLITIVSLPFMSEKIRTLINETNEMAVIVEASIGSETTTTPQRFTSLKIALKDFRDNPILGLGGNMEESWITQSRANISPISGIGNLLAHFGVIGFLFFSVLSFNTSIFLSKHFNYNNKMLFFIIIFLISVSYTIILLPLFMSFWMFRFFTPLIQKQDEVNNISTAEIF